MKNDILTRRLNEDEMREITEKMHLIKNDTFRADFHKYGAPIFEEVLADVEGVILESITNPTLFELIKEGCYRLITEAATAREQEIPIYVVEHAKESMKIALDVAYGTYCDLRNIPRENNEGTMDDVSERKSKIISRDGNVLRGNFGRQQTM